LFGDGMAIGPGLTGSNRANLDYILTNILDPSAEVGREYLMTSVSLNGGRVVSGMVVDENSSTITLQSGTTRETIRKSQILSDAAGQLSITRSSVSLMPPGQLQGLSDSEVRDLIAYLASSEQAPLPE
jgi:putative heme-binding domain-containing protein